MDGRRPSVKPHKRAVNKDVVVKKMVKSEILCGDRGDIGGLSSSEEVDGRVV